MEKAGTTWRPWRSWTVIALALATLALVQACGQSGSRTGPTSDAKLELKLRRVGGAELQAGCTGTYSVSGPGVNIQNAPLPADGQISFQGQVGQTYTVSVQVTCQSGCTQTGTVTFTLQQGPNKAEIVLTCSKVLGLACQSPVAPNQVSHCTCSVQSAGSANIAWQGATPTGGNTAEFSSPTEGSFPVTCTINGVDSLTTNVKVESGTGTIEVSNPNLGLRKRNTQPGLALRRRVLGENGFGVLYGQVGNEEKSAGLGQKMTWERPAGHYDLLIGCFSGFVAEQSVQVTQSVDLSANETESFVFDWFNLCYD